MGPVFTLIEIEIIGGSISKEGIIFLELLELKVLVTVDPAKPASWIKSPL